MRARQLAYGTCVFAATALLAAACGSDDEEPGSTIPTAGTGGASGNGGSSNAGNGNGGTGLFGNGGLNLGGDEPGADASCGENPIASSSQPVNILIVMDKSGSMDTEFTTGVSRWNGVKLALNDALAATQETVDFGLVLYPYDPNDTTPECALNTTEPVVPITADATNEQTTIGDALNATAPSGGTPTAAALALALDYYTNGAGAALEGGKYVLLATDGGPNCNPSHAPCPDPLQCTLNIDGDCNIPGVTNCCDADVGSCLDDAETIAAVTALADAGVDTFVVGMPGTEAYQTTLNALADAGGHPRTGDVKYYSVSEAGGTDALTAAFEDIAKLLITECVQQLATQPPDLNKINVDVDGVRIYRDDPNGWILHTDTTPATIEIVGTTCEQIKTTGAESISIVFGCPTEPIPR